ncbi:skin secretory protein xP2-like [Eublepharis macularius]|uniref:Skin secretory protein xP2-like n=1 Tax=Eublepharis macularius TaxID=481883 RepID=A0AA97KDZ4_EUBMA|nr:skin secretory protein xP2-like [Eublepharis macularius]
MEQADSPGRPCPPRRRASPLRSGREAARLGAGGAEAAPLQIPGSCSPGGGGGVSEDRPLPLAARRARRLLSRAAAGRLRPAGSGAVAGEGSVRRAPALGGSVARASRFEPDPGPSAGGARPRARGSSPASSRPPAAARPLMPGQEVPAANVPARYEPRAGWAGGPQQKPAPRETGLLAPGPGEAASPEPPWQPGRGRLPAWHPFAGPAGAAGLPAEFSRRSVPAIGNRVASLQCRRERRATNEARKTRESAAGPPPRLRGRAAGKERPTPAGGWPKPRLSEGAGPGAPQALSPPKAPAPSGPGKRLEARCSHRV